VHAESGGEGQGATFTVNLPLMAISLRAKDTERVHPTAESGAVLTCPPELAGLKVLLVDDETDTLDLLTVMLAQCGAEVRACASSPEALAALSWKPDVLVSDIGMPVEDGYALIRQIRTREANHQGRLPAIALTAYAREEDRVRALRAGFQMHVAKPINPAELVTVIASLAGRIGKV
jgi:CheY-like chemotaxis protein